MKKGILAALLLTFAGAAFAQIDPARVIAVVDGTEIKGAEYYRRMEFLPGVGRVIGNTFQQFFPGFMTLEQLINEKLIFELAKSKGVLPTDAQIKDELDNRVRLDSQYVSRYLASGRNEQDLNVDMKFELAQLNLLTAGITVTDQEVEQFYAQNHPMFTTPARFKLRLIAVTSKAQADATDQDLATGKKFEDVAKAHSVDASATIGGDFGYHSGDEFPEEVRKALTNTKPGDITPWFSGGTGENQFKFQVIETTPEKLQDLTAEIKREARLRMRMDRGRIKNDIKKDLDALRRKATIEIKDKALSEAYKKYIDAYFKATGG